MSFFSNLFKKNTSNEEERLNDFFKTKVDFNEFTQKIISHLYYYRSIKGKIDSNNPYIHEIETLEKEAFNLLIMNTEIDKGTNKVEVGVIGDFSSGKSTFINSLFKKKVCPMAVQPTTSSITKFYYGAKEKITLNNQMITYKEYLALSQHQKNTTNKTKHNQIEYAYPFKNFSSLILYDTPGFGNDHMNGGDTQITMKALEKVDVVFVVVDISKGTIDNTLEQRLQNIKDKKLYCILNKSDLKSPEAVEKIKKEIEEKKLFKKVITYSSIKVLEEGEKDIFNHAILRIEEEFIVKQKNFTLTIDGLMAEKQTRKGTINEYQVKINDFFIDTSYKDAQNKRKEIEEILNTLSDDKKYILESSFEKIKSQYTSRVYYFVDNFYKNILTKSSISNTFEFFTKDIEKFTKEMRDLESKLQTTLNLHLNMALKQSLYAVNVSDEEMSYWSTPYAKIGIDIESFRKRMYDSSYYINIDNALIRWQKYFLEKYDFEFTRYELKSTHIDECFLGEDISKDFFFKSETGVDYFEDIHKARNAIEVYKKVTDEDMGEAFFASTIEFNLNKMQEAIA